MVVGLGLVLGGVLPVGLGLVDQASLLLVVHVRGVQQLVLLVPGMIKKKGGGREGIRTGGKAYSAQMRGK